MHDAAAERFAAGESAAGARIRYEHWHRYALAAQLAARTATARGRALRALDVGCGSGYGASWLREQGAQVTAVDLDPGCVRAAAPGARARAEALPFPAASFDLVTCFETIEHVAKPAHVVAELARILRADGIALLSTPNRALYSDRAGHRNPYHLAELDRAELQTLLGEHFTAVKLRAQSVWAGSWIGASDHAQRSLQVLTAPDLEAAPRAPWCDAREAAPPAPLYLVAFCAHDEGVLAAADGIDADSVLHDARQALLGELHEREAGLLDRNAQIERMAEHARSLEARGAQRQQRIDALLAHAANLEQREHEAQERVQALEAHARGLEQERERSAGRARDLADHAANLEQQLRSAAERVGLLELHASGLEDERDRALARTAELERHARSLQARGAELETHAANLEAHRDGLEAHVANLEARRDALETHSANLEAHVANLEAHSANLEALRGEHEREIGALQDRFSDALERLRAAEQQLAALRRSPWVRLLRALRLVDRAERG